MKSKFLTITAIFFLIFTFNAYADKDVELDSFDISKGKIVIGRTLTYGLFKEDTKHKFEYDGNKRDRVWEDYFVHTKLLKSKSGLVDTSDYKNQFVLDDGDYKLYTEFTNLSAPAIMNYVTPVCMLIDIFAKLDSKGDVIELLNKIRYLAYKVKDGLEALDAIVVPLHMIVSDYEVLEKDNPFRKDIEYLDAVKKQLDTLLSSLPLDHVEVGKDKKETMSLMLADILGWNDKRLKEVKAEFTNPETYKNIIIRYFVKEILKPVSVKRKINGKEYDTLDIYLYEDLHLGDTVISKGNYMPIDYVVLLVTNPDRKQKKYYRSIIRYFTKSGRTNAILSKLESNFKSLRDFGKAMKSLRTLTKKVEVAQLEGVAKYITHEVIKLLGKKLEGSAINLATELVQYLVPGVGQAKAVVKAPKVANKLGKFTYDTFTAPRVIPFKVQGEDVYLSYFADLYKYSFLLYPDGVNEKDPYNTVADATYESYFLYGTGLEENGFKPYDINNRLATLVSEGATYSYTFNIGAYDGRGEAIRTYVDGEYDKEFWFDKPAFSVTYQTLRYPGDNLDHKPEIFISDVTDVTNKIEPMPLKFPGGAAEQFETMHKYDRPSAIEFVANPDADRFTYFSFQEIFTHHLREMGTDFWGRENDSFWKSYEANTGITHITPGIYHIKNEIKILPIKDEDEVIFGDDHLMFVMANIKKAGEDDKNSLPKLAQYQLTKLEVSQLEYDGKYDSYFIDIYLNDVPKRDMLFSIYDLSKEDTDPEAGVSIRLPKDMKHVKADLPDFLFNGGTNYKIFYHSALSRTYADFINISESKLHLDLYQRRVDNAYGPDAIRRIIGYVDDFENEKVNNLKERNIFIGENKTVRSFSQDGNAVIVGSGFGDTPGEIEVQTFGDNSQSIQATIGSWSDEEIRTNIFPSGLTFDNWSQPLRIKIKKAGGALTEEFLYPFRDVEPNKWYTEAIVELWKQQIIHGVGNTEYFKPADEVTRAAFLKMLTELLSKKENMPNGTVPVSADFKDWYYPSLQKAYGYVNPNYNDEAIAFWGPSGPGGDNPWGQHVLRSEAAHMMMNAAKVEPPSWSWLDDIFLPLFSDVPKDSAEADWIYGCRKAGIFDGNPDNTFKPDKVLNRAEAAQVLSNAFLDNK